MVQALGPSSRRQCRFFSGHHDYPNMLLFALTLIVVIGVAGPVSAQTCPDLSPYYPGENPDWQELEQQLSQLMPLCLESSEFFALLGAARLNSGLPAPALEALERAILLEPDNGAAQIDYAEALFQQGQLFPALEMNQRLLARQDLPANLRPALEERQASWRALTRESSFQADFLAGFDSNLNGAPDPGQITLTLSGEPVLLPLNPEFRPIEGPYLNSRLAGRYRQLAADHQHNASAEVRGRLSENTESDLLQFDGRYAFIKPGQSASWQLIAGMSHLFFGGSGLYSAAELGGRYQWNQTGFICRPFAGIASQLQLFHGQSRLNGIEAKASGGLSCPENGGNYRGQTIFELGLISNEPQNGGRPGGGRSGWQLNLDWQRQWRQNSLRAVLNHTRLDDRRGYSPLLAGGATREVERSYVLLQYQRPLTWWSESAGFIVNIFHQHQSSNIELFDTRDTTIEAGIRILF